jgi:hypothetical protein
MNDLEFGRKITKMAPTTMTSLLAKTWTSQYEFQYDLIYLCKKFNLDSQFNNVEKDL